MIQTQSHAEVLPLVTRLFPLSKTPQSTFC